MAHRRINVLVYAGNGCTIEAVRHCVYSLRRLLAENYAVITIDGHAVLREPWTASCALFVMPGGADLAYCRTLNGAGNRKIVQYVERGGAYLGFCAGAYYGSARCEFEEGNPVMEVVGDRELAFFPGICRGLAFPGFVYHSEAGTRAVDLKVFRDRVPDLNGEIEIPSSFRSYYNGGGVFVDAPAFRDLGVEVLAEYTQQLQVRSGEGAAAVIYRTLGDGSALLCATHPEFAVVNLDHQNNQAGYDKVLQRLTEDDAKRVAFLKGCLLKLGLKISPGTESTPSLSRLHLSSISQDMTKAICMGLDDITTMHDGEAYIEDENDVFHLEKPSSWNLASRMSTGKDKGDSPAKRVIIHEETWPVGKETPCFNHEAFYANLRHYAGSAVREVFGASLLYGEVVTSTSTLLEKKLLARLPSGLTATATVQVAGRGRGSNVWVSPAGALMFSTIIRHPQEINNRAPIVFLQYLAALAIVEGIQSYQDGFDSVPVKIKWPNDVYALDPVSKNYTKISGILVNTHYDADRDSPEFLSVVGIGINTHNAAPTISLNSLRPPASFTLERLLARVLTTFSHIYQQFCHNGWDEDLQTRYYRHWLHDEQIVTLEAEGGMRARILGISTDWGLLKVEELGWEDRPTGRTWQLQSDSNSFDFFHGLIKRKS